MKIAKILHQNTPRWAVADGDVWRVVDGTLDDWLSASDFMEAVKAAMGGSSPFESQPHFLAPIGTQEVWAAGVTYKRSQEARKEESKGSDFYDRVYAAARPEIFFKGTASRACGPGEAVGIRHDSGWNVPEPELTLVVNSGLRIVGYTVGNDLSSRDIEGENPLYLPQAKTYKKALGLGPHLVTADEIADPKALQITLSIFRDGDKVFEGSTSTGAMQRGLEELVEYLGRSQEFPQGAFLLTGTGIVPPDGFSLEAGDSVRIEIAGVGLLENPVVRV